MKHHDICSALGLLYATVVHWPDSERVMNLRLTDLSATSAELDDFDDSIWPVIAGLERRGWLLRARLVRPGNHKAIRHYLDEASRQRAEEARERVRQREHDERREAYKRRLADPLDPLGHSPTCGPIDDSWDARYTRHMIRLGAVRIRRDLDPSDTGTVWRMPDGRVSWDLDDDNGYMK